MTAAEARREAYRILRDAAVSMRRDISEVERLLNLAEEADDDQTREVDPEFRVSSP